LKTLKQVLSLLDGGERRRLGWLLLLTIVMAMVQMVGVASIMPFMSLIANPGLIQENRWMTRVYELLAFSSPRDFLFFAGVVVLALIALGNAFKAFTNWLLLRFSWGLQHSLSVRLLDQYLHEPYSFYLNRNSTALAKNILAEVAEVLNGVIKPGMKVISQGVIALAILVLLVVVDVRVALTAASLFAGAFGVIYFVVRRKQFRLGKLRNRLNTQRFRASTEALAGIKETKVLGRERQFLARFSVPAREYSRVNASNAAISELPKYALETLAFGGIVALVLYQLTTRDDLGQAIAAMSLYALAGYRLMPALEQVFNGLAKIRFFRPALENLHAELRAAANPGRLERADVEHTGEPLTFRRAIAVEGAWFRYPGREEYVARDVSISIPRNSTVGFVGSTGSGKTTLADLLLGLLEPERGCIRVDGVPLNARNLPAWQRRLGYVPQQIYLCDDTVTRNIAFGIADERIDHAAVERAARIANLHDFILSLPQGYDTVVGDRGVRLSGGQRQRIGIARSLYHDPEVLIMDEATSALDGITEDAVMSALSSLAGRKTIILIAHRLSTVQQCDVIHLFHQGEVAASGTYDELIAQSREFRAMARVADAATGAAV
jgi:ATP-binding cassette, subfamily B, bacterial PglK